MKKYADPIGKLSNERIRHDARMSKDAYFRLEHKFVLLAQSHDKLLAKFDTHVEAMKVSKHTIAANAYKLGYLDCMNGAFPYCLIKDEDADQLTMMCPLLKLSRSTLWT
ncbi:unnamed protein product [Prunus armeniaca]